ncbi:MAG TPA: DinB family protein [Candidatus Eisenbacteria bacterium]|nr:DinB family protein [Candidatus Eisenbacteria bacterium]
MSSVPQSRVARPADSEVAPSFVRYLNLVPENDIVDVLERQIDEWKRLAASVTPEREDFRYAPGKWTVRDVFNHIIDGERVFGYRLLSVMRGEQARLPGFEENDYVLVAHDKLARLPELVREFATVREGTLFLARQLDEETSVRQGDANGFPTTARGMAWVMAGHMRHHMAGLQQDYGLRSAGP